MALCAGSSVQKCCSITQRKCVCGRICEPSDQQQNLNSMGKKKGTAASVYCCYCAGLKINTETSYKTVTLYNSNSEMARGDGFVREQHENMRCSTTEFACRPSSYKQSFPRQPLTCEVNKTKKITWNLSCYREIVKTPKLLCPEDDRKLKITALPL